MNEFVPDELERGILELWGREETFAASLKRRKGSPRYSFYDGPPYATGSPHYGHILQTTVKDTVTRYWTMRGYLVDRRVGWDCHGLPVETMVESEFNKEGEIPWTKRDIEEKLGIERFNAACRSAVLRHVDEFTKLLGRLGRWADYDQAYKTMDTSFMESAWWVFKTAWDRGLVYRGLRPSPYCPRCETPLSNFETTLGYEEVTDPSVTVKVRLADEENVYLLVWTTTPWTLTANVAIAVHPDLRYVRARVGSEIWIVAKDRVDEVIPEEHHIEDEFAGSALVGRTYQPMYQFVEPTASAYRVVAGTFVSSTDGTGLVHVAPAFGEEDFRLAETEDLPLIQTVDDQGRFLPVVAPWSGRFVKDADADIIKDLETQGMLLRADTIRHDYPHCWRCSTPLLYMTVDSWFVAVTKIKDQLVKNAEQIHWVPDHLKGGRFGQGLRDAPDWAVSRTRYWGVPLPVWQCTACEEYTVVGSVQELRQLGGDVSVLKSPHADPDLHRPYVDGVTLRCAKCGGGSRRVPDVLDVWFDSGSMPYGQWHYPFENKEVVEATFPADFIGEALEQTRGWFYTLHVLAGILTVKDLGLGVNQPAFKNVVASGLVLAEDGRKLSKRFGNYPEPDGIVSKYGADTLRLYLLSSAKTGEDYRFSDRLVGDLYRRFTLLLWNVWQFYRTYGSTENAKGKAQNAKQPLNAQRLSLLDRWMLARTAKLAADVQAAMDAYRLDDAARALLPFVDDLSTWYVRRSRGREGALPVLREVLRQFSVIAAPFIPFLAEHIHRELTGRSPHLEDFPEASAIDAELLEHMSTLRAVVSAGLEARTKVGIKVRQPLQVLAVVGQLPFDVTQGEWRDLLASEMNVKEVQVRPEASDNGSLVWTEFPGGKVGLSTEISEDLAMEGMLRDLIRRIQDLRKRSGLTVQDTIELSISSSDPLVQSMLENYKKNLLEGTRARALVSSLDGEGKGETVSLGNKELTIRLRKI